MKLKCSVETNKVGSECEEIYEIDDSELDGMDEAQREAYFDEILKDHIGNHIDAWRKVVDE